MKILLFFLLIVYSLGVYSDFDEVAHLLKSVNIPSRFSEVENEMMNSQKNLKNFNFESTIFSTAKSKMNNEELKRFIKWYESVYFWSRDQVLEGMVKSQLPKLAKFKEYDRKGERPLHGYLEAKKIIAKFPKPFPDLINYKIIEINKVLLSKDSIQTHDAKLKFKDGYYRMNSENTEERNVGKIREEIVLWHQYLNQPINPPGMVKINGESLLKNSPRSLKQIPSSNLFLTLGDTININGNLVVPVFYEFPNPIKKDLYNQYYKLSYSRREDVRIKNIYNKVLRYAALTPEESSFLYNHIESLIIGSLKNAENALKKAITNREVVVIIANLAHEMLSIHPFLNGNGRTVRVMVEDLLHYYKLPSPIYTYSETDVTLSKEDYAQLLIDSVVLGKVFNDDVIAYLKNDIGYDLVSSHLLVPNVVKNNLLKDVVPFQFMAWLMAGLNAQDDVSTVEGALNLYRAKKTRSGTFDDFFVDYAIIRPYKNTKTLENIWSETTKKTVSLAENTLKDEENGRTFWPSHCRNSAFNYHPIKIKWNGLNKTFGKILLKELDEKCMPEFVFSWMSEDHLKMLLKMYGYPGSNWNVPLTTVVGNINVNALFTSFSPAATFGYGENQVRIKLKKTARFFLADSNQSLLACNEIPPRMKNFGVIVRPVYLSGNRVGVEYNLCSFGPVHSWSYNRRANFFEIEREIRQTKDNDYNVISYLHAKDGAGMLLLNKPLDGLDFSGTALLKRLDSLVLKINKKEGDIFYPIIGKSISEEERENHYYPEKNKIYWNKYDK